MYPDNLPLHHQRHLVHLQALLAAFALHRHLKMHFLAANGLPKFLLEQGAYLRGQKLMQLPVHYFLLGLLKKRQKSGVDVHH